jgi:hypothetical protein
MASSLPTTVAVEQMPTSPDARIEQPTISTLPIRGTSSKSSVAIDTPTPAHSATSTTYPTRKLARRDSLDRREALLKGKEGSRQRRRWENGTIDA